VSARRHPPSSCKYMNKFKFYGITALGFGLAAGSLTLVHAGDENLDAATKARIERFERGPATIDVSKYPQAIQDRYALFSQKCTQCHKLSRPINSDYALPSEWSRYIKRMMHKPGSGISNSEGKKIYEFLVYDASARKKAMLDQKLAALSPAEKKTDEDKLAQIHKEFDNQ
jgi:hypothetical protein